MNKRQAENIARDFWIKCYNAQDRDGDYSEIEKEYPSVLQLALRCIFPFQHLLQLHGQNLC